MNFQRIIFVSVIFSLALVFDLSSAPLSRAKLSPLTWKLIHDLNNGSLSKDKAFIMNIKPVYFLKSIQNKIYAGGLLKINDKINPDELNSLDVKIGTKAGNIWSINVPLENVESLTKINGIDYIQIDEPIKIKLDSAIKTTQVNKVHQGMGLPQSLKGKGVIVGVVDGGFDYTNPVFYDTSGNTRIKRVWEQNAKGIPPKDFSYGNEFSSQSDLENFRTDSEIESHGTHVAAIAGGSGELSDGKYVGMAPECEFVFVSRKDSDSDSSAFTTGQSQLIDGISYVFNYAESVGKPAVVNLSLGYHIGPHDGTSLFDLACDALVGPGKILIGAAGNEGNSNIHIGYEFNSNDTIVKTFAGFYFGGVDIWGEEGKNFCFQIKLFDHNSLEYIDSTTFFCSSEVSFDTTLLHGTNNEECSIFYYLSPSEFNNKPRISFNFLNLSFTTDIALIIKSNYGKINMWNTGDMWFDSYEVPGYSDGDNNCTMGEIGGTGKNIITVGAYTSKNTWYNYDNEMKTTNADYSDIAKFSSMGPTIDRRTKPDITAPGSAVISAINSNDIIFSPTNDGWKYITDRFNKDNKFWPYAAFEGTSMATPCVVGIVALLLQVKNDLTPSQIKDILKTTAIKDSLTGTISSEGSNIWGWGKVNAWDAVKEVIKLVIDDVELNDKNIIYPNPNDGKFNISIGKIQKSDIEIFDYLGNRYLPLNINKLSDNLYNIDISYLPQGVYYIGLKGSFGDYERICIIK
ncbi:MAG: T9SS type A sorting domain-containing protein [Bacteroidetes bacterium]|nr:MAG: T9SS type A sorting domain-containing protein [Bacteroidota bacterium]